MILSQYLIQFHHVFSAETVVTIYVIKSAELVSVFSV